LGGHPNINVIAKGFALWQSRWASGYSSGIASLSVSWRIVRNDIYCNDILARYIARLLRE
jgi:hypothetical protein